MQNLIIGFIVGGIVVGVPTYIYFKIGGKKKIEATIKSIEATISAEADELVKDVVNKANSMVKASGDRLDALETSVEEAVETVKELKTKIENK